jgi:hypothetical protein
MLLTQYGERQESAGWAAIGRSLVLSCIQLVSEDGLIPAEISWKAGPRDKAELSTVESEQTSNISSAEVYSILTKSGFYPHATPLSETMNGLWVWSMSPEITANYQEGVLDIAVRFPVASPHYFLIRGVPRFSRIQMRELDYRSDPQFERYNSPGWVYNAAQQTLCVKMVNRIDVEHILVFF